MTALAQIHHSILAEGLVDSIGLWEVVRRVRRHNATASDDGVRSITLQVVRDLLSAGYMRTGQPLHDGSFVPSAETPAEAMRRIEAEWMALGRDPDLGDIVWLSNTEKGNEVARALRDSQSGRGSA